MANNEHRSGGKTTPQGSPNLLRVGNETMRIAANNGVSPYCKGVQV